MMDEEIARRIVRRIPPKHWLPLAVVAAITIVVVFKFTTDTVVSISDANREVLQDEDEDRAKPPDEATMKSMTVTDAESAADTLEADVPEAPPEPAERMVPESLVHLLVDNLNKKDEMWGKLLAKRDQQITQLTRQVADLQGQLNEQQQQLADIRSDQVQQAWAEVDRFHAQQAFGIHGRTNNFVAPEQNGVQAAPATPASRQSTEEVADDPFAATSATFVRTVTRSRTSPRRGYINVNPTRKTVSSGPAAGSAKRRIEKAAKQHRESVDWTRKYHDRSGSSRVLGEMEAGNR